MTAEDWLDLKCHASMHSQAVHSIQALARRSAGDELWVSFRLDGDFSKILIPVADKPRINVDLWRHTCFEAFIALEGQPAYHEFNFAPSGEWCIYAFRGYRDGGPLADETIRPYMAISSNENQLELDAVVRLDRLSAAHPQVPIRIGLSAVIEASDGFSYWALRHPAGKPDFHKPDGFALLINPPSPAR